MTAPDRRPAPRTPLGVSLGGKVWRCLVSVPVAFFCAPPLIFFSGAANTPPRCFAILVCSGQRCISGGELLTAPRLSALSLPLVPHHSDVLTFHPETAPPGVPVGADWPQKFDFLKKKIQFLRPISFLFISLLFNDLRVFI